MSLVGFPRKFGKNPSQKIRDHVQRSRDLLEQGRAYRQVKRHDVWRQSERQYEGDHWPHTENRDPLADLVVVNQSFSTIQVIVPYITGSEPHFIVEPYSADATMRAAKAQEAYLNRWWNSTKSDAQQQLVDAAIDALVYGDGYVKSGYTIVEKQTSLDEFADIVELWVQRVSPWDVWIDPYSDGIHNARWVAHRVRMSRYELENDDRYRNTGEDNVHAAPADEDDAPHDDSLRGTPHANQGEPTDLVEVWDFYDLVTRTLVTFAQGDLPLRYITDVDECPIVQIANYRIPNSPYHMGDLEQLWPLQQEINKTRSQQATHRRRNAAKFASPKGALSDEAKAALQSEIVGAVVEFDNKSLNPREVIFPLELPPLSNESYAMSDIISNDIYEISGLNEYLRGAAPPIRRTATEASIIEGSTNVKTAHKLRMVERTARTLGRLLLRFAQETFPETDYDEMGLFLTARMAESANRADVQSTATAMAESGDLIGAEQLASDPTQVYSDTILRLGPEEFEGEYEVMVEQASTELRSPAMRAQQYRDMLETLAALAPQTGVQVNFKHLMEMWLEAEGIKDVEAMFDVAAPMMPAGDPMAALAGMGGMDPMVGQDPSNTGMLAPGELGV